MLTKRSGLGASAERGACPAQCGTQNSTSKYGAARGKDRNPNESATWMKSLPHKPAMKSHITTITWLARCQDCCMVFLLICWRSSLFSNAFATLAGRFEAPTIRARHIPPTDPHGHPAVRESRHRLKTNRRTRWLLGMTPDEEALLPNVFTHNRAYAKLFSVLLAPGPLTADRASADRTSADRTSAGSMQRLPHHPRAIPHRVARLPRHRATAART